MTYALYLFAPDVTGGGEGPGQLVQVAAVAGAQAADGLNQKGPWEGALKQALDGADQQGAFACRQGAEHRQPPVFPLAGGHSGIVEGKFPCGKRRYGLPSQGGEVPSHALGLALVGADYHRGAVGLLVDAGGKIRPMNR